MFDTTKPERKKVGNRLFICHFEVEKKIWLLSGLGMQNMKSREIHIFLGTKSPAGERGVENKNRGPGRTDRPSRIPKAKDMLLQSRPAKPSTVS